jgi:hypothetical protein
MKKAFLWAFLTLLLCLPCFSQTTNTVVIQLNWGSTGNGFTYNLYRATVSGGPYQTLAQNLPSPSFTDTVTADGSTLYYAASAVDGMGNIGAKSQELVVQVPQPLSSSQAELILTVLTPTPPVPTGAPPPPTLQLSALAAGTITETSAVVTWTSNLASNSQVSYAMSPSTSFATTNDATLVTSHSITLIGLQPNTTYSFFATSTAGSQTVSTGTTTFKTLSTPVTNALPATFFGHNWNTNLTAHFPNLPFGGQRLWDTKTTWAEIETSRGTYTWTALDAWLNQDGAKGKDVLYTFGRTPPWASSQPGNNCSGNPGGCAPPSDVDSGNNQFKEFVTALINHNKARTTGKITALECWNEFNVTTHFWNGTAAQMVKMCDAVQSIANNLDPSLKIVGPSPSDCIDNLPTMDAYFAAGGASKQDIISCHFYLPQHSSSNQTDPTNGINQSLNGIKSEMATYGISGKPIWMTEGSWGQNTSMNDAGQVAYLTQIVAFMWAQGVERFYWYAYDSGQGWGTLANCTGTACTLKAVGVAYGKMYNWFVDSTHGTNPCVQGGDSTWTCSLTAGSGFPAMFVFNRTANKNLTVDTTKFGHYELPDGSGVRAISGGVVPISSIPVFITK